MAGELEQSDRAERLLKAAANHASPPDVEFLASLRARSAAEFARAHAPQILTSSGRWQMFIVRAVTALVASAALLGSLWVSGVLERPQPVVEWASADVPPLAETSFGEAFARLGQAEFFTAEFTGVNGEMQHVSGAASGQLRFDSAEPDRYVIVDRDRQYQINEAANRAEPARADYYYRREGTAALSPWRLVRLEPDAETELSYHEEEVAQDSQPLLVTYFSAQYLGKPVAVEGTIDPIQKLPRELVIWPREGRGARPLAQFQVIQAGGAGDATKFKVAETLTEDGRIGKVVDAQGLVTFRPLATSRWTPVYAANTLLQPNDWLRTDNIGANAVTVLLAPQTKLILGPGTLVELPKPDQVRVHAGIVQITASDKTPVTVTGPDGKPQTIRGQQLWRVDADNQLAKVAKDPPWLLSYAGQAPAETLGSLVALVDGRNVPLSVGYHKVTVDIRDQIARTTIEESFVNHTDSVLEGQFYFPLPQDASISGFGMWIGDKLVEADIVEKQRAREIYETILREKRDPGLLEWTGGNIFKARVYPIPGRSEKRIKITYTQVLPLVGDSYRYSYALQSDLLKQSPLRQLELAVTISSTQPLDKVHSPTHGTRNQTPNAHTARLEFSAQNYTPTRDFEVVAKLANRANDLAIIPHQRGDVGFFMLMLQPPNAAGAFTRELVKDGEPLDLLILADTSASMDRVARTRQVEVIAALLGSLAPQDKFNLATCDVDCLWAFEKAVTANPDDIKKARDILANRRSMGWTNLQKAWESALGQAAQGTHVIYVGDGVITRGLQDYAADAKAIERAADGKDVTGHAISVSSSFESQILKAIAKVGGGSVRNAGGDVKPQQVAHDLLLDATRPALRNIQVSFCGIETAAVYPETLTNLPVGTQQIVLGRYRPRSDGQQGEVLVTGTIDGKPAIFRAPIDLRPAPAAGSADDASFIPRLWARLHLDHLLAQGSSQQTQDEIIALSEEYHIITPYTSLLVLETDADRERFKVKKRFQMRDGERFFHEHRKNANYALVQQQIQLAQAWRQQLRQQVLNRLSGLGRDAGALPGEQEVEQLVQEITRTVQPTTWYDGTSNAHFWGFSGLAAGIGGASHGGVDVENWVDVGGPGSVMGFESNLSLTVDHKEFLGDIVQDEFMSFGRPVRLLGVSDGIDVNGRSWNRWGVNSDSLSVFYPESKHANGVVSFDTDAEDYGNTFGLNTAGRGEAVRRLWSKDQLELFDSPTDDLFERGYLSETKSLYSRGSNAYFLEQRFDGGRAMAGEMFYDFEDGQRDYAGLMVEGMAYHDRRVSDGFQRVSPRHPLLRVPVPYHLKPHKPRKIETTWPAEAVALLKSLRMEDDLRKLPNGLSIVRQDDGFIARNGKLNTRQVTRQLYSQKAWLTRDDELRSRAPLLVWCDEQERGNQSLAYDMALVRKSEPIDLEFLPLLLNAGAYGSWDEGLPDYEVKIEKPDGAAGKRALLIVKASDEIHGGYEEYRWLIDTERRVVLESERRSHGQLVDRTRYDQFVQVGERWLATSAERFDSDGKVTSRITLKLQTLNAEQFQVQWQKELAARDRAVTLQLPLPKFADAEQRVKTGQATVEDHFALLARNYGRNQREEAWTRLEQLEKLAAGKAGWTWVRLVLQEEFRRHEDLKQLLTKVAEGTVARRHPAEFAIVHTLRQLSTRVTGGNEQLDLLEQMHPAWQRFAEPWNSERHWEELRLESLSNAGKYDEHREYLAQLAAKYPERLDLQNQYINGLQQAGEIGKAFAWIEQALQRKETDWDESQRDQLRAKYCDLLESEGRYADGATYAREWLQANPKSYDACQRLLAYLVLSGAEPKAFEQAIAWLDEHVPAPGKPLAGPALFKVQAAVQLLIGEGRNINRADLDPKYLPRLEKLVAQFAGREDSQSIAWMIWQADGFDHGGARTRLSKLIFDRINNEAGTLPLADLRRLCDFVFGNSTSKEVLARWRQVRVALERRWEVETKLSMRTQYRELILRICSILPVAEREAVLRKFLAGAKPKEKDQAAHELFDHWLSQPWTKARETESLLMIEQLSSSPIAEQRLSAKVQALYRWTDTWVERRREYLNAQIKRPDKLKGEELSKLHAQNERQAKDEISQRLAAAAQARQGKDDAYARWLQLEQLTLEIRLERKLAAVSDQLWRWLVETLDQKPAAKADDDDDENPARYLAQRLQAAWQQRILTSLLHLATRPDAPPAHVARLTKLIEDQRQLRINAPKDQPPANHINWQRLQYDLLVSQDKPKELLAALQGYVALGDSTGHWRRVLARVLAELNRLEDAVVQFEELDRADLLGGEDYQSLSVWYQALDERQKHEAAQVKVYRQQQPWQLDRRIRGELSRWQRSGGPLPEELNPQVLLMFDALLKTEDSPAYYLNTLREFYNVTHDTRLLQSLAKALPGHTAERVYAMLSESQNVLREVEHEATIDELIQGLETVRKEVKTDLDLRALDLLELLAHRRGAELQNGAKPHVLASVAALERATKREWLPGEPRHMASFLASLGKIAAPELAAAQIDLLESLASGAKLGTEDALLITASLAQTQWLYERHDQAINLLSAAADQYRATHGGKVNSTVLPHWFQVANWKQSRGHYLAAEELLTSLVPQAANRSLEQQIVLHRYGLYASALRAKALTSLGSGETLYRAALARLAADAKQTDSLGYQIELVGQTINVYRAGHDAKIFSAAQDLLAYSRNEYPPILARQVNGYENSISEMASALADVAGKKEGIRFILDRADNEPNWVKYQGNDAWSRWGYRLGEWRLRMAEAKEPLGDVEPRLLAFVIKELKRELTQQNSRNRAMYHMGSSYPWPEQKAAFAAAAEEVLKERGNSGRAAMYSADYFFYGLERRDRAAEIILAAHRAKLLDENQQMTGVYLLQNAGRYAETIPILEPLVKLQPLNLTRRVYLLEAYFHTKQPQALLGLLQATDKLFHQDNHWTEGAISQLGRACLTCELYEQAVEYLKEAIATRATAHRGEPCKFADVLLTRHMGDGEMSSLYRDLARSYAGLKNTELAVDAAASAVVVWPLRHHERENTINVLRQVLQDSPDLKAYVKVLDKQTQDSGQDKPIVRKLLGQVFQDRRDFAAAVAQYRIAVQLSPGDAEVHTKLIDCLDAVNDQAGAIAQSLDFLDLNRRNFDVWQKLGERFDATKQPAEAERARTSLAEVAPGETEGHVKLAEIRETQERLPEALEQWQVVGTLRKLEPTGLLNMARLQLALKQKAAAAESVRKLDSTPWPERFQAELQAQLPELRKQAK